MLTLKLLGGAVLEDAAGSVCGPVTRRHPMALLALLATAPSHTLSRGKLVGLLWPETTEKKARNRLNTCVYQIRSEAGRDVLASVGDDLRLDANALSCDVCRFESAVESGDHAAAVDHYQGPFLDGFHLDGSPAFEKRIDQIRSRLRRDYLEALEALARAHEERGEAEEAARRWRERAEEDPYDSRVTKRLMEALADAGNRAAAIEAARRHADRLQEEVGAEPDPGVREMAARLREAPSGAAEADDGPLPRRSEAPAAPAGSERGPETDPAVRATGAEAVRASTASEAPPRDRRTSRESMGSSPYRRGVAWSPSRLALGSLVVIGLLAAAAVAGWYLVGGGSGPGTNADRTLAVVPFENGEPGSRSVLTGGIYGEVLTQLSTISDLTVVSPEEGRTLASAERPLREVAGELGIEWVVRGVVVEEDSTVRVDARLLDVGADRRVWTQSFRRDRTVEALTAMQRDITREIVSAVEAQLTPEEERRLQQPPTESTAAYELYLRAREADRPPVEYTENLRERIVDLLERALELDPEFAEAWAWLADVYVKRAWAGDLAWADSAIAAARRALELDPDLAAAYAQLGDAYWAQGRPAEEIVGSYRKALELRPNVDEAANNLVAYLARQGRYAEKMQTLETLRRTSPGSSGPIATLAVTNALLGRDSLARAWLAHGRESGHLLLDTRLLLQLVYWNDVDGASELLAEVAEVSSEEDLVAHYRAILALYESDWEEARRRFRRLYDGRLVYTGAPGSGGLLYDGLGLAYALDRLGSREEARELARDVVEGAREGVASPDSMVDPRLRMAVAHLLLDDTTSALDWLDRAVDVGYRGAPLMESTPVLAPLRSHPRFEALLGRVDGLLAEERRVIEQNGWGVPPESGD